MTLSQEVTLLTMTAPRLNRSRLALIGAIAATLLLAGCSSPSTPDPADPGGPTTAPEPTVVSLSELDFPYDSTDWIAAIGENRQAVLDWQESFSADCTAELAGSADSPDCTEAMLTGLQAINAVKTSFDFSFDNGDYDSGDYSGLTALVPTRTAVQTASDSGSDFIDTCYYVPGGDGSGACVAPAQTFLDDVDAVVAKLATWEP